VNRIRLWSIAEAWVTMVIPLPVALTVTFPERTWARFPFDPVLADDEDEAPPASDAPPEGPLPLARARPGSRTLAPRLNMAMTYEFARRITNGLSVSLLASSVPTG
jgi:hypothetical protein